jgi:protein TonB
MNPVSESPSLPSSLAIVASLVLVCGGLLLLTSTAPWTSRPDAASDVPAPVAFAPPTNNESSPAPTTEADRGDATEAAEAQPAEAAVATSGVATSSVAQIEAPTDAANAAGVDATEASAADVSEVEAPEQVDAAGTEAAAAEAIAAESMSVSHAEPMPEDALEPGAEIETAAAGTEPAETPPAAETGAAATDQIGAVLSESPPQAIATETIAEHDNESVTPSPEAASAEKTEAPGIEKAEASGNVRAQATAESTRGHPQAARAEVTAAAPPAPPPPLPKRKPEIQTARTALQPDPAPRKEGPKQTEVRPAVAQAAPAQPAGDFSRWLPMALAPADKPVAKEPQRLTGPGYSSKVWSALARHKPRAGQNGSATVVFSIGMGGGLNSLSIGKSSGNARIDQLALATVRGAAPFPPPPSAPASFSIRIDFH